jgi:hypothetical protein
LWGGCVPKWAFPELFSFAKSKDISLQGAADIGDLQELLHLPISAEAFNQLETLLDNIDNFNLNDEKDAWVYIWGTPYYSSQKAYKCMKGHREVHPSFQWLWRSCSQLKPKIFFWLLLKDRLNVRGMLRRRTTHLEDYSCVFCPSQEDETVEHLFMACPFAQLCPTQALVCRFSQI